MPRTFYATTIWVTGNSLLRLQQFCRIIYKATDFCADLTKTGFSFKCIDKRKEISEIFMYVINIFE